LTEKETAILMPAAKGNLPSSAQCKILVNNVIPKLRQEGFNIDHT